MGKYHNFSRELPREVLAIPRKVSKTYQGIISGKILEPFQGCFWKLCDKLLTILNAVPRTDRISSRINSGKWMKLLSVVPENSQESPRSFSEKFTNLLREVHQAAEERFWNYSGKPLELPKDIFRTQESSRSSLGKFPEENGLVKALNIKKRSRKFSRGDFQGGFKNSSGSFLETFKEVRGTSQGMDWMGFIVVTVTQRLFRYSTFQGSLPNFLCKFQGFQRSYRNFFEKLLELFKEVPRTFLEVARIFLEILRSFQRSF